MEIEILKTFVKVSQVKSIQKAADELFVSQSSIVNRIRILEKDIGCKLFFKNGRGLDLTNEGKTIIVYVKKTLEILDEGIEELKVYKKSTPTIQISAFSNAASYILPEFIKPFHKLHPTICVNLKTEFSTTIIDWVINGKSELGIIKGPLLHSNVKSITMCNDHIVLVVNKNHPWARKKFVSPIDFTNEFVLPFNRKSRFWKSIEKWFDAYNIQPNIGMEFDHLEAIKQMVFRNEGVAFINASAINDIESQENLKVVPVKPILNVYRETLLICHSKKPLSTYSQLFWDYISSNNDYGKNIQYS